MALNHCKHREEFIKQKLSHSFFASLDLASKLRDNAREPSRGLTTFKGAL